MYPSAQGTQERPLFPIWAPNGPYVKEFYSTGDLNTIQKYLWGQNDMSRGGHNELIGAYNTVFKRFSDALKEQNAGNEKNDFILQEILVHIDIYKYIVFPYGLRSVEGSVVPLMFMADLCQKAWIPFTRLPHDHHRRLVRSLANKTEKLYRDAVVNAKILLPIDPIRLRASRYHAVYMKNLGYGEQSCKILQEALEEVYQSTFLIGYLGYEETEFELTRIRNELLSQGERPCC